MPGVQLLLSTLVFSRTSHTLSKDWTHCPRVEHFTSSPVQQLPSVISFFLLTPNVFSFLCCLLQQLSSVLSFFLLTPNAFSFLSCLPRSPLLSVSHMPNFPFSSSLRLTGAREWRIKRELPNGKCRSRLRGRVAEKKKIRRRWWNKEKRLRSRFTREPGEPSAR